MRPGTTLCVDTRKNLSVWYCFGVTHPTVYTGVIDVTRRGVGYFSHESQEHDTEIAPEDLGTALNGDEVEIVLTGIRRGRTTGAVRSVIARAQETFVGTLMEGVNGSFILKADDQRFYPTLRIAQGKSLSGSVGDKVLAHITRWHKGTDPVGAVSEVIGKSGEHETEMRATVLSRGMKLSFPHAVEQEAERIGSHGLTGGFPDTERRDFRGVPTFTIDPEDAKDFDDALSIRRVNEHIEVGIHIADVSHYVRPNSALDAEARTRGTSIYLVDRTIPMLPEVLSNDLCSLKPEVDRLAFSAVFLLDMHGVVHERWFGKTLIHSQHRFTYQSAQRVLDTGTGPLHDELLLMQTLGHHLRTKREKQGALAFDTDEVRFELAPDGTPIRAYVKERTETMRLIEDWMLLANQEVARFVSDRVKGKKPIEQTFIYRIHDTPKSDRIEELRIFLKAIGHALGEEGTDIHARHINTLLKKIKGTPEEAVVQMATLRSMAKAVYSHKNIGHFSLAFSHYTHFTSPIRRYADVMVHRILESHLTGAPIPPDELREYQRMAMKVSEREVAAVEAERDSTKYKQVEYMSTRIGHTFDGIVTGVTENGVFIAEKESRAEGMAHVSTLSGDYYQYNAKKFALIGNNTRRSFRMGDSVRVTLKSADKDARRIDWTIAS